jgi:hypothetical protein
MLVDRFYCFYGEDIDPDTGEKSLQVWFPHGKKFIIVTSQEAPEVFEPIHNWLNLVATAMNAGAIEFLEHCGSQNSKYSAANNRELMARARSLGNTLI